MTISSDFISSARKLLNKTIQETKSIFSDLGGYKPAELLLIGEYTALTAYAIAQGTPYDVGFMTLMSPAAPLALSPMTSKTRKEKIITYMMASVVVPVTFLGLWSLAPQIDGDRMKLIESMAVQQAYETHVTHITISKEFQPTSTLLGQKPRTLSTSIEVDSTVPLSNGFMAIKNDQSPDDIAIYQCEPPASAADKDTKPLPRRIRTIPAPNFKPQP